MTWLQLLLLFAAPGWARTALTQLPGLAALEAQQALLPREIVPADPSLLRTQAPAGWTLHSGTDCYAGRGGTPLLPDPHGLSMSLAQCLAACRTAAGCRAVVRRAGAPGAGRGVCYLRKEHRLAECVLDDAWDLYTLQAEGSSVEFPDAASPGTGTYFPS
jgi:hypothetical protein